MDCQSLDRSQSAVVALRLVLVDDTEFLRISLAAILEMIRQLPRL